jgi:hypothetical protein
MHLASNAAMMENALVTFKRGTVCTHAVHACLPYYVYAVPHGECENGAKPLLKAQRCDWLWILQNLRGEKKLEESARIFPLALALSHFNTWATYHFVRALLAIVEPLGSNWTPANSQLVFLEKYSHRHPHYSPPLLHHHNPKPPSNPPHLIATSTAQSTLPHIMSVVGLDFGTQNAVIVRHTHKELRWRKSMR